MAIDYKKEGRIAIFTINRPEAMNAMNIETLREFREAIMDFRDDDELWVGIVTGAGEKAFCGGADIKDTLAKVFDEAINSDKVKEALANILVAKPYNLGPEETMKMLSDGVPAVKELIQAAGK